MNWIKSNNSLCLQWVCRVNFSSIYFKPSRSFCSIGVSQYSQENTCARVSFFINSLQLQAIPIKIGAPALVFSWQLKFLKAFLIFNQLWKKSIVTRNVDQIFIRNLITQLFGRNFDKISVFWQQVKQSLIIPKNH